MPEIYYVRKVCETETNGRPFHFFRMVQNPPNPSVQCPDHPEATTRDFVIERTEEIE